MSTSLQTGPSRRRPYRFSVDQYDELARLGILAKSDRVELIDGLLVEKTTRNERHLTTTWLIHAAFVRVAPPGWFAVAEWPIVLDRSEPEPDVMLVKGRIQDYFRRKPKPEDVAIVVEVSDMSYADDRSRRSYYAESLIPVYWIANIRMRRIEVYGDPSGPGERPEYRKRDDYEWTNDVPVTIDGRPVALVPVKDLMSPFEDERSEPR